MLNIYEILCLKNSFRIKKFQNNSVFQNKINWTILMGFIIKSEYIRSKITVVYNLKME